MPSDSAPRVTDSQLFNPTFETNKSLIDLQLGESSTYFVISIGALTLALIGLCAASYCGCGPSARRARRERAEYNRRVKVSEQRHLLLMQEMNEAQERLQALTVLNEKRRLEHPHPEGGVENSGASLGVSTLGEDIVNIPTSDTSDATTSGVVSGHDERGIDTPRTGFNGFNYSY